MRAKTRIVVSVAVVAALALAGCSKTEDEGKQSEQEKQSQGQSQDAAHPPLAEEDINPQSRNKLAQGGELRMAISSIPTTYNPMHVNGNHVDMAQTIGTFVLVQNWVYAADGSFKENPNFVRSYELHDGDGKELPQKVTLSLNEDAVWGDGTPITWKDYAATWQACDGVESEAEKSDKKKGSDQKFLCAGVDGYDEIESVEEGDDEFEVVVTFKDFFPDWPNVLATVLPAAGVKDAETFNEAWDKPDNDWFTGPYRFAGVDSAQKVVELQPNPLWWGNPAMLDSVTFKVMSPQDEAEAFTEGKIDVLADITGAQQYLQAQTRDDIEIRQAGGFQWEQFTFNGSKGPLSDKKVRSALIRGINRTELVEAVYQGIPEVNPEQLLLGNHFFMPNQAGYHNNGGDFAYDPHRAKEELDELGWKVKKGNTYRSKDGKTLKLDYLARKDHPTSTLLGEHLQEYMREIGVKVEITEIDTADFLEELLEGKFGVTAFGWQGTHFPLADITQLYGCEQVAPEGQNYSRVCSPEIDELAQQIAVEPNRERRLELGNDADQVIWDNSMVLPLYRRLEMTAVPTNLANYGAFGMASVQAEDIGYEK